MRVNEAHSYYLITTMSGLTVMLPSDAPIESLCVNMTDTFTSSSMEKLSFTISSVVVIHFQFSQHVTLIKNRILHALDFSICTLCSPVLAWTLRRISWYAGEPCSSCTVCTVLFLGIGVQCSGRWIST